MKEDFSAELRKAREDCKTLGKLCGEMATRLKAIRDKLETIVCTDHPDAGVVLLSQEGTTHYDAEKKCHVYDHEFFSPLGDALIEAWMMTDPDYAG